MLIKCGRQIHLAGIRIVRSHNLSIVAKHYTKIFEQSWTFISELRNAGFGACFREVQQTAVIT